MSFRSSCPGPGEADHRAPPRRASRILWPGPPITAFHPDHGRAAAPRSPQVTWRARGRGRDRRGKRRGRQAPWDTRSRHRPCRPLPADQRRIRGRVARCMAGTCSRRRRRSHRRSTGPRGRSRPTRFGSTCGHARLPASEATIGRKGGQHRRPQDIGGHRGQRGVRTSLPRQRHVNVAFAAPRAPESNLYETADGAGVG